MVRGRIEDFQTLFLASSDLSKSPIVLEEPNILSFPLYVGALKLMQLLQQSREITKLR